MTDARLSTILIGAVLCSLAIPSLAQQNVGGITGTVKDPSGSVVPNATVVAIHEGTGQKREAISGSAGIYNFRLLQIGDYTISVASSGFKTYERAKVPVVSGEIVTADIMLEVGAVSEKTTVVAEVPILDTTSESVGTTRTSEEIGRLPIALTGNSSRTALSFARTVTGVNYDPREAGGQEFMIISRSQINGSMAGTWGYRIDGVEAGMGEAESGSDFMAPTPEAIGEFRVTANADASSGFNGGVTIEMVMKSGTNDLHGSTYYFLRNNALGARNFFNTTTKAAEDKQNNGGFALGGPIWKDKTFFFTTLDIFRFRTAADSVRGTSIQFGSLPTPLMRNGDFSELLAQGTPIYDPASTRPDGSGGFIRTMFPGNIIPSSRISPISLNFQKFIALPTRSGTQNNWIGTPKQTRVDKDQWSIKIDHNLTSKQRLTFAYEATVGWFLGENSGKSGHSYIGGGSGFLTPEIDTGFIDDRDSYRFRFNYIYSVSPSLIVALRSAITRNPNRIINAYPFSGPRLTYGKEAGLRGLPSDSTPTVNVQGFSGFGPPFSLNYENIASQKTPVSVDASWFKGSHSMKLGADFIGLPFSVVNQFNSQGTFSFMDRITGLPGNTRTGSGWASFLLGEVDNLGVQLPIDMRSFTGAWGFFAQDQWRINPKLTLTFGLRWNLFVPMREIQDKISSFDPNLRNPAANGRLGALTIYGDGAGRNGLHTVADYYYKAFSPHFGFAYSLNPKTVFRASYNLTYSPYWQKWYGSTGPTQPTAGFSLNQTLQTLDSGLTPAFDWDNGVPLTTPQFPIIDPSFANNTTLGYIDRHENRPAMSQNISFEVGRELPGQLSIRAAWVANLTRRMPTDGAVNLNVMPLSALGYGSLLNSSINSPEARAAGIPIPYPGFNSSVAQALRPYPQFLGVPLVGAQVGSSTYHAMQLNVQKRLGDLTFLAAYTISKQLTNTNYPGYTGVGSFVTQHPDMRGLSKEMLNKDRPQVFNISWSYDLPFGRGKRFLAGSGPALNQVVGGWRLSAIQSYFSGYPLRLSTRQSIPGGLGGIWALRVQNQPAISTGCASYDPGDPARNRYLNPAGFTSPPPFTLGTVSQLPDVRECAYFNEEVQINKVFPFTERVRMHVGSLFENIFNRHAWRDAVTDVDNQAAFGQFTAATFPRSIQLYMKVEF